MGVGLLIALHPETIFSHLLSSLREGWLGYITPSKTAKASSRLSSRSIADSSSRRPYWFRLHITAKEILYSYSLVHNTLVLCTAGPPAIQLVLVPAGMIIMPEFNSISLPTMNRKKKKKTIEEKKKMMDRSFLSRSNIHRPYSTDSQAIWWDSSYIYIRYISNVAHFKKSRSWEWQMAAIHFISFIIFFFNRNFVLADFRNDLYIYAENGIVSIIPSSIIYTMRRRKKLI